MAFAGHSLDALLIGVLALDFAVTGTREQSERGVQVRPGGPESTERRLHNLLHWRYNALIWALNPHPVWLDGIVVLP